MTLDAVTNLDKEVTLLDLAASLALNPVSAILELINQGKSEEAKCRLMHLEKQWSQYIHYQRRLADHRMYAYKDLNDNISDFIGFVLRGMWKGETFTADILLNKICELMILSIKYRPLYQWDIVGEFDQLRDNLHHELSGRSEERGLRLEYYFDQLKKIQSRLAYEAKVVPDAQEISETPMQDE